MSVLFSAINIGKVTLPNRVAMAPMQQYQGTKKGYATDYHVNHYAERAKGGVGLVIIESTAVAEGGRLFQNDIGLFSDDHIQPLKNVVDAVHEHDTPIFIQLCHGGRKSSPENNGPMLAPSAIAFDEHYGTPNEMTSDDIQRAIEQFEQAAQRAMEAGFDGIELHAAHGYLIHQFLSPVSNERTDSYGGTLEKRARFLKEVLIRVRKVVGSEFPVQIRFSATDYHEQGLSPEEIGEVVQLLEGNGVDAVHISSGGLLPIQPSEVFPGYQVPMAETVKTYTTAPVMAVGLIHTKALAEDIIASGKAELIAVGRPLLEDADFVGKWKNEKHPF